MKLYFTQDVKPDLCKSTDANTELGEDRMRVG